MPNQGYNTFFTLSRSLLSLKIIVSNQNMQYQKIPVDQNEDIGQRPDCWPVLAHFRPK